MNLMLVGTFFMAGLSLGAIYALSGVGLVMLYRTTGVLNFAYGAVGALAALVSWQVVEWGAPGPVGWLAALAVGAGVSLAYGRLVAPHVAYREPVVKAVARRGLALILMGTMNLVWGEAPRRMALPTDTLGFDLFGVRLTATRLIAIAAAVTITLGLLVFLARSRLGLWMRAVAEDRDVSSLLGVRILAVETWAWTAAGVLAGFTGVMLATMVRLDATVLTFLVVPALAAAIFGRLASLWKTLLGGLAIGILEAMLTLWPAVSPYRSATPFLAAIFVILWLLRGNRVSGVGGLS